ncbi:type II toxin-antitoxin system RelE family toxin [Nesterenkonia muleiensis]|uniref:type II toxin-antitoxin system RelE family toxin n=1 Tax=Nesterenkonia muleiensis TaxID=2282648 RepID=UPI00130021CF|nr:type II toxin-antitoxin system mRNA interferase toxin, RelE/StbE family [Nesterenkonia muleiensis]
MPESPSWRLIHLPRAQKSLRKRDKQVAREVRRQLDRLTTFEDLAQGLKPLSAPLAGHILLRVFKDWRVLIRLRHGELVIVAVDVDHRLAGVYD